MVEESFASTSRATSILPQITKPNASVNSYLVGSQLDEALASGQDILVFWPFGDGGISDWTQAEAIWCVLHIHPLIFKIQLISFLFFPRKYVLFSRLQRRRIQNESPVLLSITPGFSRESYERICQVFFERFNVAGFCILERPMTQIYATNSLSGVVVDIGQDETQITPIYEGFIIHPARGSVALGVRHCQHYLAHLLRSNQNVISALSPPSNPLDPETLHATLLELVKQLWNDDTIKVPSDGETAVAEDEGVTDIAAVLVAGKEKAVIESGMKKKATAKASAAEQARAREIEALDLITVQFREHSLTFGKERHRFCEPLYDPSLLDGIFGIENQNPDGEKVLSLQEAVGNFVNQTEVDQRQYIWQGLFVTGDITRHVKGQFFFSSCI